MLTHQGNDGSQPLGQIGATSGPAGRTHLPGAADLLDERARSPEHPGGLSTTTMAP
jgi:hypothetical protein